MGEQLVREDSHSNPAHWYLAQTKPRQEDVALVNLERQQFLVRLPKIPRLRPSPRLPPTEVLFPGYIFFAPHSVEQSIAPVRSTLGISRVVRFGVEPALLPNQSLEDILAFVQDRQQAPGGLVVHLNRLAVGAAVLVAEGPFAGFEGLVSKVASDRVMVLLNMLGKSQLLGFEPRVLAAQ